MRSLQRRLRGLTLIELMIGLAICATLMSLAVPSFQAYLQRQRLKAAAQTLAVDFAEARFESARRGTPLHLSFVPGTDWCWALTTSNACDCRVAQACRLKAVRSSDFRGVELAESAGTSFDPATGTPQGTAAAVLQTPAGERLRVDVSGLGRPRICAPDRGLAPFSAC